MGGKFEESYTPTIEDFHRKLYRIRSEVHQLDILDTSGNHPFPAMRRLSFLTGKKYFKLYIVLMRIFLKFLQGIFLCLHLVLILENPLKKLYD